ncbi:uncharacterized protein [Phaseolus vulgaris]|uniref:uncharacterized protein n=1 Tax=Phaseolus vulgaris TaxID=3885 RepID=UPI0035CB8C1C
MILFFERDTDMPLYIYMTDLLEFVVGDQKLSINIIQFFMMYLSRVSINDGNQDVYGFLDPYYINPIEAKKSKTKSYITYTMSTEGKQIYLCPYINEGHWQLLVLSPVYKTAVWFCSLHKKPSTHLKNIIDVSWLGYNILKGRSSSNYQKLTWLNLKCNRQSKGYECGYYVMQWMITIVRTGIKTNWEKFFMDESPVPLPAIECVRHVWATYFLNFYNSRIANQ